MDAQTPSSDFSSQHGLALDAQDALQRLAAEAQQHIASDDALDLYGSGSIVQLLDREVAAALGKPAAAFVTRSTGTGLHVQSRTHLACEEDCLAGTRGGAPTAQGHPLRCQSLGPMPHRASLALARRGTPAHRVPPGAQAFLCASTASTVAAARPSIVMVSV